MKFLRIKFSEDNKKAFRSIHPGFEIEFNPNLSSSEIEPIGLAGLNGSGKSNLLELISEIFYYLDSLLLNYPSSIIKEKKPYSFEFDYAMPIKYYNPFSSKDSFNYQSEDKYFIVRVTKVSDKDPQYFLSSIKNYLIEKSDKKISIQSELYGKEILPPNEAIKYLLPKNIIAYTSGLNELLSNAYYRMQFHYFNDYKEQLKQASKFQIERSRLFFSDNDSNALVFISNYLLGNSKVLNIINSIVKISGIHSFRITIRFHGHRNRKIKFNQDLTKRIELLKRCSTML